MKSFAHSQNNGQHGGHWIYAAVFITLLTGCSGNSNNQPVAPPAPEPEPDPSGRLVGSAILFPEQRPTEGYLHIRAFDNDDVESIVHESSVNFDNVDEGIVFEVTLPVATTASRSPSTIRCPSIGKTNPALIYQERITVILVLLLQVVIHKVLRSLRITIR